MNSFQRSYKRFIIILVVAIVVAGLFLLFNGIIGVLTGPAAPTCTDAVQNQGEEGIDCGGSCEECFLQTVEPIVIRSVDIISTLPGFVDIVVWMENPNDHAGASRLLYTVVLSDGQGEVTHIQGDEYLLPGEFHFFVHQRVAVARLPQAADVVVDGVEWQEFDRQPQVTLRIVNDVLGKLENSDTIGWQLRGVVTNESSFDLDTVDVVTVLRNATGDVIAAGRHEVNTLRSMEERAFLISWPVADSIVAAQAQTRARTNIFSNINILLEYGAGEAQKFQQF